MEFLIGSLLLGSGVLMIARGVVKRKRKPAFYHFAKTSQELHELQKNRKRKSDRWKG